MSTQDICFLWRNKEKYFINAPICGLTNIWYTVSHLYPFISGLFLHLHKHGQLRHASFSLFVCTYTYVHTCGHHK